MHAPRGKKANVLPEQEYRGALKVVKVEADPNQGLINEYKVYGLPTFVVFKQGEEVRRGVGSKWRRGAAAQRRGHAIWESTPRPAARRRSVGAPDAGWSSRAAGAGPCSRPLVEAEKQKERMLRPGLPARPRAGDAD